MAGIVQQLTAWLVLAAAGAFAAAGETSAVLVIALGTAGVVITDHVWYYAGSLGGDRLLRLYCRLTFSSPECVQRTPDWFKRFGTLTIVVGRFVAVVRVLAWPLARDHGVGYATFLALDVAAALVWTAIWVGLGWLLGARWAEAPAEIRWISVAVAIAAAAGFLGARWCAAGASDWPPPSRARPALTEIGGGASRGSPAIPRARPRP